MDRNDTGPRKHKKGDGEESEREGDQYSTIFDRNET